MVGWFFRLYSSANALQTPSTIAHIKLIHSGAVTHHQDQSITSHSFNVRNMQKRSVENPIFIALLFYPFLNLIDILQRNIEVDFPTLQGIYLRLKCRNLLLILRLLQIEEINT